MKKIKIYDICWHKAWDKKLPEEVIVEDFTEEEIDDYFSRDDNNLMLNNWLYDKYGYSTNSFTATPIED